jgi:hypothetical protein
MLASRTRTSSCAGTTTSTVAGGSSGWDAIGGQR